MDKRSVAALLLTAAMALVAFSGCSSRREQELASDPASESSEAPSAQEPEPQPEEPPSTPEAQEAAYSPRTERYYDYVTANPHISFLLSGEREGGFSDAEMAAYVIGELSLLDRYDYEAGHPKEEFDQITDKYFGTRIESFENTKTTVIPETGNITSTGWGGNSIHMVLEAFEEGDEGICTARFYSISVGMGDELPDPETLKRELLSGKLDPFGPVWLIETHFVEKTDSQGNLYFQYMDMTPISTVQGPYVPYSGD